jgi:DNA-binding NarL/FixJ family response regulator
MLALVRRVLVADDETACRDRLGQVLRDHLEVVTASSYDEVLPLLEAQSDSIQLLFLGMSHEGAGRGSELLLRSVLLRWPALPTVVMSTGEDTVLAARLLRLGVLDCVPKSRCTGDFLSAKLQELLADAELTWQIMTTRAVLDSLVERRRKLRGGFSLDTASAPSAPALPLDTLNRNYCGMVLSACNGSIRGAARVLGAPYSSLRGELVRWGLVVPGKLSAIVPADCGDMSEQPRHKDPTRQIEGGRR